MILFAYFYTIISSARSEMNIELFQNIIHSFRKPVIVTGLLCNNADAFIFMKSMSAKNYACQIYDIDNNFDENYFRNAINLEYSLYVLDLNCKGSPGILAKVDGYKLFASPNRWVIINSPQNATAYFKNLNILPDSDVTLLVNFSNSKIFAYKIYRPTLLFGLIYEKYGVWERDRFKVTMKNAYRRRNLRAAIVRSCLVITHNNSLNHLLDKRDPHIDTIAKVNYVFMLHLQDLLNVTMTFSIQSTWGYRYNKSEWSGMIGELSRKEADIGGTPLFLTSDRVSVIDYVAMTTPTKSKFVFRQPKLSYITNVFTLPFKTTVWISSAALVILISIALYVVAMWESRKTDLHEIQRDEFIQPNFFSAFFMAFGAVCQQGSNSIPHTVPGRIITIILFTSFMFLYASYSANIVALLQSSSTSIQTLNDLLHSRLQVGVDDTVFNRFYFPSATEPTRRAIYQQKVIPSGQPPRYFPIEEGVKMMRQGLFAFHMETGAGYKLVGETFLEGEKCDLEEIQFLQVPDPWLAIQKNSSYKEMIKIGLKKIRESGLQSREVSLLYTKKPACVSRSSTFVGVSIVDCYPAAQILLVGYLIALVIFFGELMCYYRTKIYLRTVQHRNKIPYTE